MAIALSKDVLTIAADRRMKEYLREYPKMKFTQAHLTALRAWFLADEGNKQLRHDLSITMSRNQYVEHKIRILIKWAQDIFGQQDENKGRAQITEYVSVVKQIEKTMNEGGK